MERMYYLISTTNSNVFGWNVYGISSSKDELEKIADEKFADNSELHNDIEAQTLYKNYRVVCKTDAIRKFHAID